LDWHLRLAYIDPVSGSILIQTILATIAGGMTFFRKSIWGLVRRLTGRDRTAAAATPAGPSESASTEKDPKVS
jgi:hypothetical protein